MLKAVIFDMDGVLINTEPVHYEVWKKTFHDRGLDIDYEHYKGCIGTTAEYLCDLILKHYGWDFHGDKKLLEEHRRNKAEIFKAQGIPRIPGVPEMLHRVHDGGFLMAVASSSPEYAIHQNMEELGVTSLFHALCSGENVAHSKPEPDVFLKAAEELGVEPGECLVIEDSTNGCKAARAAGMACIGYYNPDSGVQNLELADVIIEDYQELTAEYLLQVYEKAQAAVSM